MQCSAFLSLFTSLDNVRSPTTTLFFSLESFVFSSSETTERCLPFRESTSLLSLAQQVCSDSDKRSLFTLVRFVIRPPSNITGSLTGDCCPHSLNGNTSDPLSSQSPLGEDSEKRPSANSSSPSDSEITTTVDSSFFLRRRRFVLSSFFRTRVSSGPHVSFVYSGISLYPDFPLVYSGVSLHPKLSSVYSRVSSYPDLSIVYPVVSSYPDLSFVYPGVSLYPDLSFVYSQVSLHPDISFVYSGVILYPELSSMYCVDSRVSPAQPREVTISEVCEGGR